MEKIVRIIAISVFTACAVFAVFYYKGSFGAKKVAPQSTPAPYALSSPVSHIPESSQVAATSGPVPTSIGAETGSKDSALTAVEYYRRGNTQASEGDLKGAIVSYSNAIEFDPKYAAAYSNRGAARAAERDLDGAISDYNCAIEMDPKHASAYINRGNARTAKGDLDGAVADYSSAIELDPRQGATYSNRGAIKTAKGDVEGGILDYDRAIELDPKHASAYANRGATKAAKGDMEGAIADYNHVIELDPNLLSAYFNRGNAKALMRRWEDALGDYQHSSELPGAYQAYSHLYIWLIRARMNQTETANRELTAFLDKRWDSEPGDWFSKVAGHLTGSVAEADLFAAANSPDAKKDRGQHCQAWFYAGMKKLLSGDKRTAAGYFQKCMATGQKDFIEYQMAQSELSAFEK
ncbi:MAG: tetratricopeptide repeat protein [Chthoniobacteraceae bacterium]